MESATDELRGECTPSPADLEAIMVEHPAFQTLLHLSRLGLPFALVAAGYAAWTRLSGPSRVSSGVLIAAIALGVGLSLARRSLKRFARKHGKQHPFPRTAYVVDRQGLHTTRGDEQHHYDWQTFDAFSDSRSAFWLHGGSVPREYVLKRAFAPADRDALRALLANKLKESFPRKEARWAGAKIVVAIAVFALAFWSLLTWIR
jgi:hypothetical protein